MVHGKIIAGVELQAAAVGIADTKKKCIRYAVTAGSAFDVLQITRMFIAPGSSSKSA
jgi:hypothetical protein